MTSRPAPGDVDRTISHDEAAEAAHRLINSHFNQEPMARVGIPARPGYDDDLVICQYIRQQRSLLGPRAGAEPVAFITKSALEKFEKSSEPEQHVLLHQGNDLRVGLYLHPAPSDGAIREALAALKPFAEAAADYDEIPGVRLTHGDVEVWQQSNRAGYRLTVDHLRNARSAVAALAAPNAATE